MATSSLSLPELVSSQAQKEVTHMEDENKVMRDNDAMLSIEEKAKAYDRLPHTSFDECGDPIDSKWRL